MSENDEAARAATRKILENYLGQYAAENWDAWIALWAEDGVLEFPYAPAGRKSRYAGKTEILAYMKATAARMAGRIATEGLDYFNIHAMHDPQEVCFEMSVRGRVTATGAPYTQKYISVVQTRDGKITHYREYWNPLASMDAHGGREVWAAAFGSSDESIAS